MGGPGGSVAAVWHLWDDHGRLFGLEFLSNFAEQVDRLIEITTKREANGSCSALTRSVIGGRKAQLVSVFAKLGGMASVAYIDVIGKSLDSGAIFSERITR